MQGGGATYRDELVVADDKADAHILAHGQISDAAAVGWGTGYYDVAAQPTGLLAEPRPKAPWLGFHGPHRYAQPGGDGGHEAALDDDREGHQDHDDGVQAGRVRTPAVSRKLPSRMGTAPLSLAHSTNSRSPQVSRTGSSNRPTSSGRITTVSSTATARPIPRAPLSGSVCKPTVRPRMRKATISLRLARAAWNRSISPL